MFLLTILLYITQINKRVMPTILFENNQEENVIIPIIQEKSILDIHGSGVNRSDIQNTKQLKLGPYQK